MSIDPYTVRVAFGGSEERRRRVPLAEFAAASEAEFFGDQGGPAEEQSREAPNVRRGGGGRRVLRVPLADFVPAFEAELFGDEKAPATPQPTDLDVRPETRRLLAVARGATGVLDEALATDLVTRPDYLAQLVRHFARPGNTPKPGYLLTARTNPTGLHVRVLLAVLGEQTSPAAREAAGRVREWILAGPSTVPVKAPVVVNSPPAARGAGGPDVPGSAAVR